MKPIDLQDETRLSLCRKNLFAFVSLCLLVLIVYSNSLNASWHLDDGPNIVENRRLHLTSLEWSEIKATFLSTPSTSSVEFFRPVSRLSLALNHYAGGDAPFGYHAVNICIHIVATLFLYLFIHHALRLPVPAAATTTSSYFVALLATAFWAIHPLQTQAVTYMVQRMTSLAAMFYVMAMYFYVKARLAGGRGGRTIFLISCVLAGLLSLGSKENALLLPVSLFLLHLLLDVGVRRETAKRALKTFALTYGIPVLGGLAALFFFTDILERVFQLYEIRPFTLWERLLTQPRVLVFYLSLLAYPVPERLSIDHDILISHSFLDPSTTLFSLLLVLAILVASCTLARRAALIAFCVFFFFLNHTLESTLLPMELVFEHRNYLPSMLLFVPVALGLQRLLSHFSRNRTLQSMLSLFTIVLLVSFGHMTFLRNFAWKDEGSLWLDCLRKYPDSFRAHHNLGKFFYLQGDERKAIEMYRKALEGKGIHSRTEKGITYFNLGLIAQARGENDKAFDLYREALRIDPCCPGAHNNLASLILARGPGSLPEVMELLKAAVNCRHPAEVSLALSNMGILLLKTGNPEQAVEALEKATDMDPGNPLDLLRLGFAYKETGRRGRAAMLLERLVGLQPTLIPAHLCLAEVYMRSGLYERAKVVLSRLLGTIDPEKLNRYLDGLGPERPLIEVTPDMTHVLPLLAEVLLEKGAAFQKAYDRSIELKRKMEKEARPQKTKEGKGSAPFPSNKKD
ncbi:MAG: tetratricopeptide repeat protein [Deltaproteobacteria bacterium]|nr:tetratricopeptide repeat protein [Deltaproteobacteria bacterium]